MPLINLVFITLSFIIFVSSNVLAKDIPIYRWVDENNVVHFSQNQPKDNNYSELTTSSSYQAKEITPEKNTQSATTNTSLSQFEKNKREVLANNEKIAEQNCQSAQLNEKMLSTLDKVMVIDANGKNKALSDKEKKAQLALSKENINLYCKPDNIKNK
jgi:hypothetical protein